MNKLFKFLILTIACITQLTTQAQNALDFDGTDDVVNCGNDTSVQISGTKITLEAWIYPYEFRKNIFEGSIIIKEDNTNNYGFMLRIGEGGKLNFAFGNGSWNELNSTNVVLSLNTWQHIAGTYDGSKMRIYVNGIPVDSLSVSATISNASTTDLLLGGHSTYSRYYKGMIDEVRVWNVCLDSATISSNMNKEYCTRPSQLKAYYKFNHGKAAQSNSGVTKLNDLSVYRNHGTLSAFALKGSNSNWVKGKILVKDVVYKNDTVSACSRYNSPSRKFTWITSGVYKDTLSTVVMGCDSIITVYLTIKKISSNQIKAHACSAYISPSGKVWTKSGVYTDYLKNYLQCDSIITITLQVGGGKDSINPVVCNSYLSPAGRTYTASGLYRDTLRNYRNCDSVISINLKVNKTGSSTIYPSVCNMYLSPSAKVFNSSGVYLDTITNKSGCDSFITIHLKVMQTSSSILVNACNSYTSPSKKYIWTTTGVYNDTILNKASCDSVITLHVILKKSSSSSMNVALCNKTFTSPSGKYIWNKSGTYKDTIPNYVACDSVITVQVNITNIQVGVQQNGAVLTALQANVNYKWLNCNQSMAAISGANAQVYTATANGSYAVEVSQNTCKDTSICYTVSGLSIADIQNRIACKISPNPNNGTFHINALDILEGVTVIIRDATGRTVYTQQFDSLKDEEIELQVNNGLYFVEIVSFDSKGVYTVVVNR